MITIINSITITSNIMIHTIKILGTMNNSIVVITTINIITIMGVTVIAIKTMTTTTEIVTEASTMINIITIVGVIKIIITHIINQITIIKVIPINKGVNTVVEETISLKISNMMNQIITHRNNYK